MTYLLCFFLTDRWKFFAGWELFPAGHVIKADGGGGHAGPYSSAGPAIAHYAGPAGASYFNMRKTGGFL